MGAADSSVNLTRTTLREITSQMRSLAQKLEVLENRPWLHPKDLMASLGISKATLYRWLKCGKLPRPSYVYGPIWRRCDLDRLRRRTRAGQARPGRSDRQAGQVCPGVRRPTCKKG